MLKEIDIENEKLSPYFMVNKEVCVQFESKMKEVGAHVKGTYGAWSFYCKAEFNDSPKAKVGIEKSKYTRDDYSMFQSVFNLAEWTIESPNLNFEAKGRKSNLLDGLGITGYKKLYPKLGYGFKCKGKNIKTLKIYLDHIMPLLQHEVLDYFKIEEGVMKVNFESDNNYLDVFIKLRKSFMNHSSNL